jgi:apolipoprotein N-acyltransferase
MLKNITLIPYILRVLGCLFFGAAAGVNISLPLTSFVTFCSLAIIFALLQKSETLIQECVLVFWWALGFVAGSTYWIVIAIYDPIRSSAGMAWTVGGFVFFIHASIYACTYLSTRLVFSFLISLNRRQKLFPNVTFLAPAFYLPLSLGIAEVVRTFGFWSMPWGMIGYTQTSNPLLTGLFPIVGIYGVTMTIAALSVCVVYFVKLTQQHFTVNGNRAWGKYFQINLTKVLFLIAVLSILFCTQFVQWTKEFGTPIRSRVVHTHMPNIEKYDREVQQAAQKRILSLSQLKDADLTFYPELYMVQPAYAIDKKLRQEIVNATVESQNVQIFGSPSHQVDDNGQVIGSYNSLLKIDKDGKSKRYAKEILLPFSEYMPDHPALSWAMPYILKFPLSNFKSGSSKNTDQFTVKNIGIAPSLCNESAYTFHIHSLVNDKNMMINSASDSWVPNKMYERHSWQILKARALEGQKPLLRANNTGFSGFIDAWGNEYQMEYGIASDVVFDVKPRYGNTPFTKIANFFSNF